jgi:hypothetical protein
MSNTIGLLKKISDECASKKSGVLNPKLKLQDVQFHINKQVNNRLKIRRKMNYNIILIISQPIPENITGCKLVNQQQFCY